MLPSLRSVALCLRSLVMNLQCDVPLGGLTEEEQSLAGWGGRQRRHRPFWGRSGLDSEHHSLCLQHFPLLLAC